MLAYNWPGNIRELQNVVRQALLNTVGPVLLPEFLPSSVMQKDSASTISLNGDGPDLTDQINRLLDQEGDGIYKDVIAAVERHVLLRVLDRTQGNISQSAKKLGITCGSLRNKIHGARPIDRSADQNRRRRLRGRGR